jgi:hypothetical protein
MWSMDIKTLFNFFKVNKQIYAIYHDIYFWELKFIRDNLKYLGLDKPTNLNDFIKSYITSTLLKEGLYPKVFNNNKASVLLINMKDKYNYYTKNSHCKTLETNMDNCYKNWRLYLRKGDIIENIANSGYRSEGICMYDGEHIIPPNYDEDDYGSPSKTFVIFKDFLPDYWNRCFNEDATDLNIIKKYINNEKTNVVKDSKFYWYLEKTNMEDDSKFYWHSDYPITVMYKPDIIQQVKNKCKGVINKNNIPIITINFANQFYNIHLTIMQINEIITTGTIQEELYACYMSDNDVYCYY